MNDYVSPVGQGIPRLETRDKITGRAVYADDMSRPDMLVGVIVPSPHAHARITGYDVSAALALDGVAAVVTGEDIGDNKIGPSSRTRPRSRSARCAIWASRWPRWRRSIWRPPGRPRG